MRGAVVFLLFILALFAQDPVRYVDVGKAAGLKDIFLCGGEGTNNYVIERLGTGLAFIDFDNDGYLDLFVVNGSRLGGFPKGQEPTNHLYRNDRKGGFQDVTREAGLLRSGWGQGVCAGDFDNDGFIDLFVTYWRQNVLYHNRGGRRFDDVTAQAGLIQDTVRFNTGCAFLDYDRDGYLDLFVSNYLQFSLASSPNPG